MNEFNELLNELDVAVEAANTSIKKDFKAASKTANKALKAAKAAMKAHNYEEAIKYCDEGIDALHNFKKLVKESGADKDVMKSSHAIAAGANCVKVVLGLMLAAAAVFISAKAVKAKAVRKRIKTNERMLGVANGTKVPPTDYSPINGANFVSPSEAGIPEKLAVKIINASKSKAVAGAISAGVVTALVTYLKGIKSGKNANVTSMLKAVDVSIKALNAVKSQCQELLRDSAANESVTEDNFVITEESAMMIDYSMTLTNIVFSGDSVMESFIEMGFDDIEACELYMDLLSIV